MRFNEKSFKRQFDKHKPNASILVLANGHVRYLFRTWGAFKKQLPFDDIDRKFDIDFQVWIDDDVYPVGT
jgi:hypothetical protein